ncbi:hypothetical protein FHW36_11548 [Chitinophaga polysaccharea]|uniref:Uncharacterized protein n=1 Tax=Chitinophaga polysaccharea TaxID=1293035 RepID=A0A561P328_9BACT|nr:hypothetical protein [Chitinophaga polysaccharea]TWF32522.1 hypothetical protein FHW36_11548 [Chitinophaga polysaccharea]
MPDNFESFIQQHRDEFEGPGPSPRVWAALEKDLTEQRQGRVVQLLRKNWFKAAVIAVLMINAAAIFYFTGHKRHQQQELSAISPDLQEARTYYTTRINAKLQLIDAYPANELGLDSTARQELQLRNDTYKALEKELKNNPGNERIRAALIRYYQLKLDLLDKILEELQDRHAVPGHTKKQYEVEI